jgi:hypothetical protein
MAMDTLLRFAQRLRLARPKLKSSLWGTPVILERGSLGEACLALDGQGHGEVLWENNGKLWTMSIGPGSQPALARLPLGDGTGPRVVLNAEGRGIALWQDRVAGERQILGQLLGGDDDQARVIYRTGGLIHHLQVAVDRRGSALVVWLLEQPGRLEVMAQAFDTRAMAWEQAPTTLGIPATLAVEPRIAVNHRAHAMVLWEAAGERPEGLVASHYWPSERIWSDRPVPVVTHATQHHQVAMDDMGNALALWIHAPPGERGLLEASFYDELSSEWGDPEVLSSSNHFSPPKLTMTGGGEALAAWCQSGDHGASRLITRACVKGLWEDSAECLEQGHGPIRDFDIALGSRGQAGLLAVHHGPEGDWVSARLRQGEWSSSVPWVPGARAICSAPHIRLCPQGASAIWLQGQGRDLALALAETC